ncbi:MAG: F0F1 ATP synthase subunit delta [Lysobacterales bacterium CG02_land_8_20_14_3_00_62_12]|nr:MAG: F0F1 ATP synthase subunit delta [Xanthomonadales bacterium CG02_land_8_20_14_3_00_62_12]
MANVETLARPYARAAFEVARSANALPEWSAKLTFAAGVAATPQASEAFASPNLQVADLLLLVMPPDENQDSLFARFLVELGSNRRLSLLAEVAAQFHALQREHEGVLRVTATTAISLAGSQAEAMKVALKHRFHREIELVNVIDPAVLGGALIDADGMVIDGSVRGRLASLESALSL